MTASVIGIGELLWDVYPDDRRLGGAPFNAVANLRRLGHPALFASRIGDDVLGRAALARAGELGVDTGLIRISPDLPTGTVIVDPDGPDGPRFRVVSPAAYEAIDVDDLMLDRIVDSKPAGIVYGTLAQRFPTVRDSTRRLIAALPGAERLYDVNLRDGCWTADLILGLLPLATLVKVNESEATTLGDLLDCPRDVQALGLRLSAMSGTRGLCITSGAEGATLWLDGTVHRATAIPIEAVDPVGAGDAFAAGLLHGIVEGRPPAETLALANGLGALVAARVGAIPDWRYEDIAGTRSG